MTLYKVLNEDGSSCNGGTGQWHRNGKWMPFIENIEPCVSGYHLCRREGLILWIGPAIWIAEYKGVCVVDDNKVVVQQARITKRLKTWNERTARLFACDCAERVQPKDADKRSLRAIAVSRAYANGEATAEELARDASAASAASTASTARGASAARGAKDAWDAWAASTASAASAASTASAARDAWAASAARGASAAKDAWDAARDAEIKWQTDRLFEYLEGELP